MAKVLKRIERAIRRAIPKSWHKYGRANRTELILGKAAPVDLIVHVGAHYAEDAAVYEGLGAKTILWVEADPDTYAKLCDILAARPGPTRHIPHKALVSSDAGEQLSFNRFNQDGSSSSVYRSTEAYRDRFKSSRETGEVLEMTTATLDQILAAHDIRVGDYSKPMLVLDVQGHELAVLKGIGDLLNAFTFCKSEVSRVPMYEGGADFAEIDAHMKAHGFALVSHLYKLVPTHGDVLFSKGGVKG